MYLYVHQYLHAASLDAGATEWKFKISKIIAGCNQLKRLCYRKLKSLHICNLKGIFKNNFSLNKLM